MENTLFITETPEEIVKLRKRNKATEKAEQLERFKETEPFTEKTRLIFKELGKLPFWSNITEQEKNLIMDYAGQSRFDKADLMFVKRMRDKILGDDSLGFLSV